MKTRESSLLERPPTKSGSYTLGYPPFPAKVVNEGLQELATQHVHLLVARIAGKGDNRLNIQSCKT